MAVFAPLTLTTTPHFPFPSTPSHTRITAPLPSSNRLSTTMSPYNPVIYNSVATVLTGGITLALLRSFEETTKRGVFDQKLNRELVHISFWLVVMLCWPLFSSGNRGAILAALVPGINIPRVLLLVFGMWKDEAMFSIR